VPQGPSWASPDHRKGEPLPHGPIELVHWFTPGGRSRPAKNKKAGVVKHLEVFDLSGILFDGPTGHAGLSFV